MPLKQDDVKLGDRVRFNVEGGAVEGIVKELASAGGVVGIQLCGIWFSAPVTDVTLLKPEPDTTIEVGDHVVYTPNSVAPYLYREHGVTPGGVSVGRVTEITSDPDDLVVVDWGFGPSVHTLRQLRRATVEEVERAVLDDREFTVGTQVVAGEATGYLLAQHGVIFGVTVGVVTRLSQASPSDRGIFVNWGNGIPVRCPQTELIIVNEPGS